jgi:outer membrane receptor for ferrienterochelin and colicin
MSKRKPFHSLCSLVMVLVLGLGAVPVVLAQSQASSGEIVGSVTDKQGAALNGATVKATNPQTGLEQTQNTNEEGRYRFALLPPGVYTVTVEASGFAKATFSNVEVTVGRTLTLNANLDPSGVQEVVNVTAGNIQVQTTRSEADAVLNQRAIENLPINGRRFQDFVTLTPTAQVEPSRNQISLAGQRGIYGANINIDGVDYNQPFFGGIRGGERSNNAFTVPQESIKEFQVIATGYSAEFGRSTGGVVNAVTKSGTNEYHGSMFYLLRPQNLSRKNEFFQTLEQQVNANLSARGVPSSVDLHPAPTQHQGGASFGGPIRKDKAFFFGAFEIQKVNQDRQVFYDALTGFTPTPATQEAFDFYRGLEAPFVQTNDAIALLGRFDYNFSENHRFNVRYSYSRNNAENATATGNAISPNTTSALSNNGTEKDNTNTVVGQFASIFGPTMVNELRAQYSREKRPRLSNAEQPTVQDSIGRFGTVTFLPTTQYDWRAQVADSLTWTKASHTIKFGGEYNHTFVNQTFGFNQFGVFNISGSVTSTVLDILSFSPSVSGGVVNRFDTTAATYLLQLGNLQAEYPMNELAFFAQDSWRVRPNLTISYGLRWEGQYNPSPQANNDILINLIKGFDFPVGYHVDPTEIPDSTKQFSPRLGFAWDPTGDSKTVIRGYGGIYYARSPALLLAGPFNNFRVPPGDLSTQLPFSTASLAPSNPLKGCNTLFCQFNLVGINLNNSSLDSLPTLTPQNVQDIAAILGLPFNPFQGAQPILMSPDFRNPKSYQAGVGIERQVTKSLTLGADFAYVHTLQLQRNRELNLPAPIANASDPAKRPFYGIVSGGRTRPIVSLGSVQVRESTAKALYRALTLRAKFQRNWGQFNAFYTYSRSLSDDDNERDAGGTGADDTFNLVPEYGLSRLDRAHQFVVNPVFFIKGGVDVSGAIRLRSGRPVDATLGFDANQDRINNDRPYAAPGIPFVRNSFRNFALYDFDVRVQKHFQIAENKRLVFSLDIFNIFNLKNLELSGTGVTNFCSPPPGSTLIPADCGFNGPTNPNFLSLTDNRQNASTFGKLLTTNTPTPQSFQAQFGARFQF